MMLNDMDYDIRIFAPFFFRTHPIFVTRDVETQVHREDGPVWIVSGTISARLLYLRPDQ